jgi:hypothetical protein
MARQIVGEEPPKIKEMVGKLEKVHGDSPIGILDQDL